MLRDDLLSFRYETDLQGWSNDADGIKLYTTKDDPINKLLPGTFVSRPLAKDTKSEQCFELAKYWMKTCLESHGSICAGTQSTLPARVVDVGNNNSPTVSLHVSTGELGEWLTLSHCWGNARIRLTTTANLMSRTGSFAYSRLPKSFRDAIFITRKLGYRYIWIDCLCIVQDCDEDWQRESVKMAEIYANSVLTLSADAATDPHKGIFKSANKIPPRLYGHGRKENLVRLPVFSPPTTASSSIFASPHNWRLSREGLCYLQRRVWHSRRQLYPDDAYATH
ncbi:hypothetical protein ONS95_007281 [Cadophora gregata]|uniref:uncharacterized protein n=1 Tax=Cadophora gregata TaxID=51156 RepID=UPI0026DC1DCA|nr:uncharacterized protein ONS95_007281 [Cadophora gregata]KAK0100834.1 hypothetical protein ONS95_007281 [Cadophora gregata]KAK0117173.1 hypothetical protein ONS96_013006 [Cadophora gregata f. sp. sojae]